MENVPPNASPASGSNLRLEVHAGPLAGKGFPFEGDTLTFGRAPDNDISLDDSRVSRYHAVLRRDGEQLILEDLGSTNGTAVNGKRIFSPHVLQPTETISIGASVFGVTGFSAPKTVGVAAQSGKNRDDIPWKTYQSSASYAFSGGQGGGNWLLWTGLALLAVLVIAIIGTSVFLFRNNRQTVSADIPTVIISSPVNGSEFDVGQRVVVQATATDASGVVRLELWVGGAKVAEANSPAPNGQSPFTAVLEWTPQVEGAYSLSVRAFNARGVQSAPTTINLNVVGSVLSPKLTATPTPTVTPKVIGTPMGMVRTDLNVRAGPGTQYNIVGRLAANTEVEIAGQNAAGSWWYIVYPDTPDRHGWVAADYVPSDNAVIVPIVAAPTKTPVPTQTPSPEPTAMATVAPTATDTPLPATATPAPTPTQTPPPVTSISFSAEPLALNAGDCTTFSWLVTNVKAVYFQNDGVAGDDGGQAVTRKECPTETTTFTLRVVKPDDSEEKRDITINVAAKPSAPSALTIVDALTESFSVQWTDNSSDETGFRVYNADSNIELATFPADATTGSINGLTCGTAYRMYVVAFSPVGESSPSNILVDQTADCP